MRVKYKALYHTEHGRRLDAEAQRDSLRGYLEKLGPHGERIAECWTQAGDAGLTVPRPLAYPEWLAFAVYMGQYASGSENVLEAPGILTVRWRGVPVVWKEGA